MKRQILFIRALWEEDVESAMVLGTNYREVCFNGLVNLGIEEVKKHSKIV